MFAAVAMISAAVFGIDLSANLIFEADYSKGTAAPVVAKGSTKFSPLLDGKITFKDGGLITGKNVASVRYSGPGNLNPGSGAIEMLVRNIDWSWDDDKMHTLFYANDNKGAICYIYKYKKDGLGGCFVVSDGTSRKSYFPRQMIKKLEGTDSKHIVVVYSPDSYAFYMDGELISEREGEIPFNFNGRNFIVGAPGDRSGREGNSWIGYIRIYDRILAGSEIEELAANAKK